MENPVLLFDGKCNLCNWGVRFVLKYEKDTMIYFTALQSQSGQEILKNHNAFSKEPQTIVFIEDGIMYEKSTAVFKIIEHLKNPWIIFSRFSFLPVSFRDYIYDLIARNRYHIFGKKESCMIPDENFQSRFID